MLQLLCISHQIQNGGHVRSHVNVVYEELSDMCSVSGSEGVCGLLL